MRSLRPSRCRPLLLTCGLSLLLACVSMAPAAPPAPAPITVGILLFDGVELLDFAGPAEVFVVAGEGKLFTVATVAASKQPIRSMGGIEITPTHAFADAPAFDILVLPGGDMQKVTPAGIDWIRTAASRSQVTMSVCMGAFLLARAGLLDGVPATTHHWGLDKLQQAAPKCSVVAGKRFVDSGRIVTTAGVTAGIDGALHLVERFAGKAARTWTADEWMEHPAAAAKPDQPAATGK